MPSSILQQQEPAATATGATAAPYDRTDVNNNGGAAVRVSEVVGGCRVVLVGTDTPDIVELPTALNLLQHYIEQQQQGAGSTRMAKIHVERALIADHAEGGEDYIEALSSLLDAHASKAQEALNEVSAAVASTRGKAKKGAASQKQGELSTAALEGDSAAEDKRRGSVSFAPSPASLLPSKGASSSFIQQEDTMPAEGRRDDQQENMMKQSNKREEEEEEEEEQQKRAALVPSVVVIAVPTLTTLQRLLLKLQESKQSSQGGANNNINASSKQFHHQVTHCVTVSSTESLPQPPMKAGGVAVAAGGGGGKGGAKKADAKKADKKKNAPTTQINPAERCLNFMPSPPPVQLPLGVDGGDGSTAVTDGVELSPPRSAEMAAPSSSSAAFGAVTNILGIEATNVVRRLQVHIDSSTSPVMVGGGGIGGDSNNNAAEGGASGGKESKEDALNAQLAHLLNVVEHALMHSPAKASNRPSPIVHVDRVVEGTTAVIPNLLRYATTLYDYTQWLSEKELTTMMVTENGEIGEGFGDDTEMMRRSGGTAAATTTTSASSSSSSSSTIRRCEEFLKKSRVQRDITPYQRSNGGCAAALLLASASSSFTASGSGNWSVAGLLGSAIAQVDTTLAKTQDERRQVQKVDLLECVKMQQAAADYDLAKQKKEEEEAAAEASSHSSQHTPAQPSLGERKRSGNGAQQLGLPATTTGKGHQRSSSLKPNSGGGETGGSEQIQNDALRPKLPIGDDLPLKGGPFIVQNRHDVKENSMKVNRAVSAALFHRHSKNKETSPVGGDDDSCASGLLEEADVSAAWLARQLVKEALGISSVTDYDKKKLDAVRKVCTTPERYFNEGSCARRFLEEHSSSCISDRLAPSEASPVPSSSQQLVLADLLAAAVSTTATTAAAVDNSNPNTAAQQSKRRVDHFAEPADEPHHHDNHQATGSSTNKTIPAVGSKGARGGGGGYDVVQQEELFKAVLRNITPRELDFLILRTAVESAAKAAFPHLCDGGIIRTNQDLATTAAAGTTSGMTTAAGATAFSLLHHVFVEEVSEAEVQKALTDFVQLHGGDSTSSSSLALLSTGTGNAVIKQIDLHVDRGLSDMENALPSQITLATVDVPNCSDRSSEGGGSGNNSDSGSGSGEGLLTNNRSSHIPKSHNLHPDDVCRSRMKHKSVLCAGVGVPTLEQFCQWRSSKEMSDNVLGLSSFRVPAASSSLKTAIRDGGHVSEIHHLQLSAHPSISGGTKGGGGTAAGVGHRDEDASSECAAAGLAVQSEDAIEVFPFDGSVLRVKMNSTPSSVPAAATTTASKTNGQRRGSKFRGNDGEESVSDQQEGVQEDEDSTSWVNSVSATWIKDDIVAHMEENRRPSSSAPQSANKNTTVAFSGEQRLSVAFQDSVVATVETTIAAANHSSTLLPGMDLRITGAALCTGIRSDGDCELNFIKPRQCSVDGCVVNHQLVSSAYANRLVDTHQEEQRLPNEIVKRLKGMKQKKNKTEEGDTGSDDIDDQSQQQPSYLLTNSIEFEVSRRICGRTGTVTKYFHSGSIQILFPDGSVSTRLSSRRTESGRLPEWWLHTAAKSGYRYVQRCQWIPPREFLVPAEEDPTIAHETVRPTSSSAQQLQALETASQRSHTPSALDVTEKHSKAGGGGGGKKGVSGGGGGRRSSRTPTPDASLQVITTAAIPSSAALLPQQHPSTTTIKLAAEEDPSSDRNAIRLPSSSSSPTDDATKQTTHQKQEQRPFNSSNNKFLAAVKTSLDLKKATDQENDCEIFSRADGVIIVEYRHLSEPQDALSHLGASRRPASETTTPLPPQSSSSSVAQSSLSVRSQLQAENRKVHTRVAVHVDGTTIVTFIEQMSRSSTPVLEPLQYFNVAQTASVGNLRFTVETPSAPVVHLIAPTLQIQQHQQQEIGGAAAAGAATYEVPPHCVHMTFGDGSVVKRTNHFKDPEDPDAGSYAQTVFIRPTESTVRINHELGLVFLEPSSVHLSERKNARDLAVCQGVAVMDMFCGGIRLVDSRYCVLSVCGLSPQMWPRRGDPNSQEENDPKKKGEKMSHEGVSSSTNAAQALLHRMISYKSVTLDELLLLMAPLGYSPHVLSEKAKDKARQALSSKLQRQKECRYRDGRKVSHPHLALSIEDKMRHLIQNYVVSQKLIGGSSRVTPKIANGPMANSRDTSAGRSHQGKNNNTRNILGGGDTTQTNAATVLQGEGSASAGSGGGETLDVPTTSSSSSLIPSYLSQVPPLLIYVRMSDGTIRHLMRREEILPYVHAQQADAASTVTKSDFAGEPNLQQIAFYTGHLAPLIATSPSLNSNSLDGPSVGDNVSATLTLNATRTLQKFEFQGGAGTSTVTLMAGGGGPALLQSSKLRGTHGASSAAQGLLVGGNVPMGTSRWVPKSLQPPRRREAAPLTAHPASYLPHRTLLRFAPWNNQIRTIVAREYMERHARRAAAERYSEAIEEEMRFQGGSGDEEQLAAKTAEHQLRVKHHKLLQEYTLRSVLEEEEQQQQGMEGERNVEQGDVRTSEGREVHDATHDMLLLDGDGENSCVVVEEEEGIEETPRADKNLTTRSTAGGTSRMMVITKNKVIEAHPSTGLDFGPLPLKYKYALSLTLQNRSSNALHFFVKKPMRKLTHNSSSSTTTSAIASPPPLLQIQNFKGLISPMGSATVIVLCNVNPASVVACPSTSTMTTASGETTVSFCEFLRVECLGSREVLVVPVSGSIATKEEEEKFCLGTHVKLIGPAI